MRIDDLPKDALAAFRRGGVIPAHPLALTEHRTLDERRQRAVSRYHLDAGSVGLAVGVHTTQFAIREAGLYEPVLRLAMEEAAGWVERTPFMVAGVVGRTDQAVAEAETARGLGYHAALLGLAALNDAAVDDLIVHCRTVAKIMPVMGFYLQPAVGGRHLSRTFWRRFAEIDNVVGIKIAPFNRYRTLDVLQGVARAGAADRIALYTGNDDHIVADLLTPFPVETAGDRMNLRIVGGLLGHWAVWTKRAVELVEEIKSLPAEGPIDRAWLTRDAAVTDTNGAFFDAANEYAGVIAGLHEVLRRQGLFEGTWCLDPHETLGPGQAQEIDRVYRLYPGLNDDAFVAAHRERWLDG
ncbi:MAG: dihydrodipicolinate synthase family protein [Geminicoccaceae bacterium]|nr:dihydrodipicolinate synthase family protein [Geminicoccaceae bacterium]